MKWGRRAWFYLGLEFFREVEGAKTTYSLNSPCLFWKQLTLKIEIGRRTWFDLGLELFRIAEGDQIDRKKLSL